MYRLFLYIPGVPCTGYSFMYRLFLYIQGVPLQFYAWNNNFMISTKRYSVPISQQANYTIAHRLSAKLMPISIIEGPLMEEVIHNKATTL
jgi:hypothetical protein